MPARKADFIRRVFDIRNAPRGPSAPAARPDADRPAKAPSADAPRQNEPGHDEDRP